MNLRLHRRSDFESHALDHSATLSSTLCTFFFSFDFFSTLYLLLKCKRWGSNPRLRRDPYLKRAPWTTRPHLPVIIILFSFSESVYLTARLPTIPTFYTHKKRQWQDLNLRLQRRSDFESHALDHSATLSSSDIPLIKMQVVGFEPTPPKRPVPETSALDHSATLACYYLSPRLTV